MEDDRLVKYENFTSDGVDVLGYGLTTVLKAHNPNLAILPTALFITLAGSHCAICEMAHDMVIECGVVLHRRGLQEGEGVVSRTMREEQDSTK